MFKKGILHFDLGLLLPICVLTLINLTTLFSLNLNLFKNELLYFFIGIIVFLGFSFVNHKIVFLYGKPIYIISLILLITVLIIGVEARGSMRWVEIYGFRIQFAELLKPFLAISLSSFLVSRKSVGIKNFLAILGYIAPLVILVFVQPDLGDALIYVVVAMLTLIFYGFPIVYFIGVFVLLAILSPLGWLFLHDYQRQRVLTFLNPSSDPLGKSYNAIQSIIAIGAGMFLGKGFGQGSQSGLRFLPERHTDFIFATISEQLGFVGSAIVVVCFLFLLYRIYKISVNTDDKASKIFTVACFFIILVQFFFNVGMNIGILPIVGITLPFLSYGGSSMLTNFIIIGLLTSIARSSGDNKVLEIR